MSPTAETWPARARRAIASVPRPLALLLPVVALFGVAWALVIPAWQAPDEDVHFAYAQTLSELHKLPGEVRGKSDAVNRLPTTARQSLSSEQVDSFRPTNTDQLVIFPRGIPNWSGDAWNRWRAQRHPSAATGGGPNTASTYPPAYYLYESVPYSIAGGNVFTRLYTMRIASVGWLLVTTVGAWLLAGEVFGRRRTLQLVTAAVVGLWPMVSFVSAMVNPDAMLYALWTLALWLGVKIIKRGLTPGRAAALFGVVGLALITKATSIALLPGVILALGIGVFRTRRVPRRAIVAVAAAAVALALPVASWQGVVRSLDRPAYAQSGAISGGGLNKREFLSYVWQFYLPRLPFMTEQRRTFDIPTKYPAYNVWFAQSWGVWGWVTVYFPNRIYALFFALALVVAAGALVATWRALRARGIWPAIRSAAPVGAFFATILLTLLAGLHLNEYRLGVPANQARYLFPLVALAGLVFAQSTLALRGRARLVAVAVLLAALPIYNLASLGYVASRYYV